MTPTKQKQGISAIACAPGALSGGPVRTRFFDGMFLTQADLENEQRFWRLKRRLTNRALGDGVVWGLKLAWNQPRRNFTLSPGYALDCCGNDLIVECPVDISEAELWSRSDPALRKPVFSFDSAAAAVDAVGAHREGATSAAASKVRHACVVLQYTECPEEARPVHRDACGGATSYCEPSRVRETARLLLVPPPQHIPSPPERFLDELKAWANTLPASIRDALFPPQTGPAPTAASHVPMHVIVTVPGSPADDVDQQPAPSGSTAPVSLSATQTPDPSRRTGVVTFELRPDLGWGFKAGTVLDQARVVETVTPPVAPSMFWSFDVALPEQTESTNAQFQFIVDKLMLAQVFGGTRQGLVDLKIEGAVIVTRAANNAVNVVVDDLIITTVRADVTDGNANDQGCFRELVPWGWTIDPSNGRRIASTLILSAVYAFLSEVVRRSSSPTWQLLATRLYVLTWYALFGAFPMANVEDVHRRKLAELILDLYKRWCEGLAYPGPRCIDEHHGVYLGCAELDRSGRIARFDMWEHRRYVVTGALLDYWAQQFGIAPIDVVVGRFARAICCVAGLDPIVLPTREGGVLLPGVGGEKANERFHVGTRVSATAFAKLHGAEANWVTTAELAARAPDAFLRRDDAGRLEVLATTLDDGGTIAIAIPTNAKTGGEIRDTVNALTRRGESRVREVAREPTADFMVELFAAASPGAALDATAPEGTKKIAKQLAEIGAHLTDVVEGGSEGALSWLGTSADAASVADLVDRSELALDTTVAITVRTLGDAYDRSAFGVAGTQTKLAKAIMDKALPGVDRTTVVAAATKTAKA
jgi:hypothetical protein